MTNSIHKGHNMQGICCSCQTSAALTKNQTGHLVMAPHAFANGKHGINTPCNGEGTTPQACIGHVIDNQLVDDDDHLMSRYDDQYGPGE